MWHCASHVGCQIAWQPGNSDLGIVPACNAAPGGPGRGRESGVGNGVVLWFTPQGTLQCGGVWRGVLSGSHGYGCYSHTLLPHSLGVLVAGTE